MLHLRWARRPRSVPATTDVALGGHRKPDLQPRRADEAYGAARGRSGLRPRSRRSSSSSTMTCQCAGTPSGCDATPPTSRASPPPRGARPDRTSARCAGPPLQAGSAHRCRPPRAPPARGPPCWRPAPRRRAQLVRSAGAAPPSASGPRPHHSRRRPGAPVRGRPGQTVTQKRLRRPRVGIFSATFMRLLASCGSCAGFGEIVLGDV
jgi:hypothetical protein